MCSVLRMLNLLKLRCGIKFASVLTDNGAELGSGAHASNKRTHPCERMLHELGIKHVYTPPYRPQTNGKVERFWRTVQEELLEDMVFFFSGSFPGRTGAICPLNQYYNTTILQYYNTTILQYYNELRGRDTSSV